MPSSLDLTDKLAKFPIAYGWQPVKGWAVKHFETAVGQQTQITKQNALAEGPWDGLEKLWSDAFVIPPADYIFHPGEGTDIADTFFPDEPGHPWSAWISARCQAGISSDSAEKLFGIYRTLKTANFNGAGVQIDIHGDPIGGGDPRDYYFFNPNPANCAVDQLLRWGQRLNTIVNFPAFVDWRDWNDELIPWDDSKYTPRSLSLTPAAGGALVPGTTYIVRVAVEKGADLSSASKATSSVGASKITLAVGQTKFQVNWLIKGDELEPPAPPVDHTAYRVYIGHMAGAVEVWDGYATVAGPGTRNYMVTTVGGLTAGVPPDLASAGLLRQIKRFECGLFFVPPYSLSTALDRICQISCADWQWSGLGTNTYRNDKVRFMSPATRDSVFTLDLAQVAPGSFKTWPTDRRSRYNQIIGSYRDRDDLYLAEGEPVILDRELLQEADKQTKSFTIDFGTCYRSQVQRGVSFWARVLCDLDQMAELRGSPKTYHLLPGDVVNVTNETPDWTDVEFMVLKKKETVEGSTLGDMHSLRIYSGDAYSDDNYEPLPSPLPAPKIDPFAVPPPAVSVDLTQSTRILGNGIYVPAIQIAVQFDIFSSPERGRIWLRSPKDELPIDGFNSLFNRVFVTGHNYTVGDPIGFRIVDGSLPPELNDTDLFFVGPISNVGAGYFQVCTTPGGPAIDLSTIGSDLVMVGEFFPTEPVLVPEPATLRSLTELVGVEVGEYRVLVNVESIFGVAGALEDAAHDTIEISIPRMPDPSFEGFYDEVSGDLLMAWSGVEDDNEKHQLQIRKDDGVTWLPIIPIEPAKLRHLNEYIIWEPAIGITLAEKGGAEFGFGQPDGGANLISKASAEVVGGFLAEFELPDGISDLVYPVQWMSIYPEDSYGYNFDLAFIWHIIDRSGPPEYNAVQKWWAYPGGSDASDGDGTRVAAIAGDRLGIYIRPDGIGEFHLNYSPSSRPVFISGKYVDLSKRFRAWASTSGGPGVIQKASWLRQGPERVYTARAQRDDNALLSTDPLPDDITARVRQISPYGEAASSNWVQETFVRP